VSSSFHRDPNNISWSLGVSMRLTDDVLEVLVGSVFTFQVKHTHTHIHIMYIYIYIYIHNSYTTKKIKT
jgi:hypothetical protein